MTGDNINVGNIENSIAVAIGSNATAIYQPGLSITEVAVLVAELKRLDQPQVWNGQNPYLGLNTFQESDAQFFFGRESLVDDLLKRVKQSSFVTIAGPSGSGKSSVARAGLFHALRSGRLLPRSEHWLLATMQPGDHPLTQLSRAIDRVTGKPGSAAYVLENGLKKPLALYEQIQTLLTDDPNQRFVLLADQFEESFTQTKEETERNAFIQLLTTAAQIEDSRTIVILALRSDFVTHCASYPDMRNLISQQFQLVGAMAPQDLTRAITLPALEVGAQIDPALVSRIMADMKGEPGALPLMSFALRDLFESKSQGTKKGQPLAVALPDYLERGGVESALERHANQVFDNFTVEQRSLATGIFSRLIGEGDTRRTAAFSELVPAGADADAVRQVVDALAGKGARLLTTSGGREDETGRPTPAVVTIAHERLIDAWPWLRRLVDENRETIALQNQIASDALTWSESQDRGYLYRGGRLTQIEEKLPELGHRLDTNSWNSVQASLVERQRELKVSRRNRHLAFAAAFIIAGLIISVLFVNLIGQQQRFALQEAAAAELAISEATAVAAAATAVWNENLAQEELKRQAGLALLQEAYTLKANGDPRAVRAIGRRLLRHWVKCPVTFCYWVRVEGSAG